MESKKHGVILLNMGGPEKQEDVKPFLNNLFSSLLYCYYETNFA